MRHDGIAISFAMKMTGWFNFSLRPGLNLDGKLATPIGFVEKA